MTTGADQVTAWLRENGSEEVREGMARYGIPDDRAFGIAMRDMKAYSREIGQDHDLALALWSTGWYEARTVAVFVAEVDHLTGGQMDNWAGDFDNWAICDTACFHLFDRSPHAWKKVPRWANAKPEFKKRAAFALLWGLSVHDRDAEDAHFLSSLSLIEQAAQDERNYVKKAVDMALRAVGKRNLALNAAASETARRLSVQEGKTPNWIGKHALRELQSDKVQKRIRAQV